MNRFTPRFSPERFAESQRLLAVVSPGVTMTYNLGFWFEWGFGERRRRKKWVPMSQGSHYPKWGRDTFGGGTNMLITSQLIRWAQQLPTCTLRSWRYWCSESVGLNPKALALAIEIGWPEEVPCVMCGRMIGTGDWFDWRGAGINCHGLGCYHEGCKGQRPDHLKRKTLNRDILRRGLPKVVKDKPVPTVTESMRPVELDDESAKAFMEIIEASS